MNERPDRVRQTRARELVALALVLVAAVWAGQTLRGGGTVEGDVEARWPV